MIETLDFLRDVFTEQLSVPTWEVLSVLAIVSIALLLRASKTGILTVYLFSLHLAIRFSETQVGTAAMMISITLGMIILFLSLVAILKDR